MAITILGFEWDDFNTGHLQAAHPHIDLALLDWNHFHKLKSNPIPWPNGLISHFDFPDAYKKATGDWPKRTTCAMGRH